MNIRRGVSAATLVGLVLAGQLAAATHHRPSVAIVRATVDRTARTADVRLRICFSSGPRAVISVSERRTVGGIVKAAHHWNVPRAEEPTRVAPFSCRTGWRVNWLLERGLTGPGTYTATIRVRDAYGTWAPPVAFSVTSP